MAQPGETQPGETQPGAALPGRAEVVVIGGGVVGCSVAYHLAQRGVTDVAVIERRRLTHGSTWHAAGLIGQLRGTASLTGLIRASVAAYAGLAARTGYATGWRAAGSLRVAASEARWAELRRMAALGISFGLDVSLLSPAEATELFPLLNDCGLHGAVYLPSDGYADPSQLTQSLAAGARAAGARIIQDCQVLGFACEGAAFDGAARDGRWITAVLTDRGPVECETVVNATGMWGAQTARMADAGIAVTAVEHQYVVTQRRADISPDLPTLRDPDARIYLKPEGGALVVGGWEPGTRAPWLLPPGGATPRTPRLEIPADLGPELFPPDHERFAPLAEAAAHRIPVFGELGIQSWINGPIPFTPDGEPLIGRTDEIANLFHCCGFSAGIAGGGGAGAAVANWIADGDPGLDLAGLDPRRFGPDYCAPDLLAKSAVDAYESYYSLANAEGKR
jgi:4-methylaminobutanoate oxidase (formaldehyde-forming)